MSSGLKLMDKMAVEVRREVISECARLYGFSAEEAESRLSAVSLKVSKRSSAKKLSVKVLKSKFALPFSNTIRADCCTGVKLNRGLYSQCENAPTVENMLCKGDNVFCTGCFNQSAKNASSEPDCGVIGKRLAEGSAWRDPKGNAPVSYRKVMKKLKLTEEQVLAEAARLGVAFNEEEHFAIIAAKDTKRGRPKKASDDSSSVGADDSKKRGRPKKAAKVVEVVSEDLFATLVENAKMAAPAAGAIVPLEAVVSAIVPLEAEVSDLSGSESESDSAAPKEEKAPVVAAVKKVVKKATKEEKAAKDAELAAKKAAKESELAVKKSVKDAELAAKEAAKAEKAAKTEKSPKVEKAKKETKVEKKEAAAAIEAVKIAVSQSTEELVAEEEDEEEEAVKVEKFEFNGVTYLRSSNNVMYDSATQDEIGVWNEAKKEITFCEPDSDEEEDA